MQTVFLDQQTFSPNISLASIEFQVSKLICYATTTNDQVLARCKNADIIITNKVVLSKNILEQLPQLKLVCIAATGMNNVDLAAAQVLGISVKNVSGYSQASVSQYVFAQMLEYFSNTAHHNNNTKQGHWQNSDTFCFHGKGSQELAGKTIGIIGFGCLGKAVATIAEAFGMKILIAERQNATKIRENRQSFNYVLQNADVISLHCPQTDETTNLINRASLSLMKPSALLINTARGALVNSEDLLEALKNKVISHAILDVLEQEPPAASHPLISALMKNDIDNLSLTAHIAWASIESQQRLINLVALNIKNVNPL
ncbi:MULTISPECIES: D-2-hydroxyacid dehydrogenase [unclassified Colwellia]|uniref:D-2-hydroxyacid dehydrogenase n=1 Tax=unclassified Colwellia TaxID=196834 RepID=UPI0015F5747D|nr:MULTISPECIES: D-2-hydroxyacid dehydrogenase [unclassified Colwellia]MBA6233213.1 D-2-hydroxyacid dehydrogenase [Colwellia sp. MB02u-7]MBA6236303.1 D-2-hydroxyacid dehydrogenase [Colwellia sp. MB02u-11]MBA6256837.1 D-2-hydroxyacid dehydrogenase [Colwellia sp. MB3u-28]MBA6261157.1 D-2-hydroxyacid dehydrogenase [Colwellia sp. MB3u-41]MBA6298297.1 D-2-hydroxyacid dehydrogenase [Colwellia sp. MB3u-22]